MDVIEAVVAAPRASDVFVIRSDLVAPWAIRVEDGAPLTVAVVLRGSVVLRVDGEAAVTLTDGDAVLVRGDAAYLLADAPGTPAQARIGPGQVCTRPDGSPLSDFRDLGVMAWGNVAPGAVAETVLLTGTYQDVHQVSRPLLRALPSTVVVRAQEAPLAGSLVALLEGEAAVSALAQGVALDRLVDLLTVSLLRVWCERPTAGAWYAAHRDAVVGPALRRLDHEPQRPWTVAALAAEVGVSRATLARRFLRQVGEPPMAYLARRRTDLAAELLRSSDLTVESIAGRVGYGSSFSLSNAFARRRGCSPTAYRRGA